MRFKKLLAAGLVLAMSLTATAGLAACGDPTPPSGDGNTDPPAPHVHTFDTTKWEYNETTHWHPATCEHTDQKGDMARHNFIDRECECGYKQAAEVYLEGMIASKPESNFASYFQQAGMSVTEVRKNCIPMTSTDGETYTAEVFLRKNDRFKVYEYSSKKSYPSDVSWLAVEEDNGYIVSWKLDDPHPTWKVHDHDFSKYEHDAEQHWKVCSLDGTVDPDGGKTGHDFTNGDCVCGQKAPEKCQHPKGYSFAYTTLPEAIAEGGELQKTCPDCLAPENVHYDKGFGTACNTATGSKTVLTNAGTYYLRGTNGFRFEATQAGTYTIRFAGKLIPAMQNVKLYVFNIGSSYLTMFTNAKCAIQGGQEGGKYKEQTEAYNVSINGFGADKQFESLTFTVKDADVTDGKKVCVQVLFFISAAKESVDTDGYLITIEGPQAASVSVAQEYALPVSTGKNEL